MCVCVCVCEGREREADLGDIQIGYSLCGCLDLVNGVHYCLLLVADTELARGPLVQESHLHRNICEIQFLWGSE